MAAAAAFALGDDVEVRTKLKQLHGGWYEATVESLTPTGSYVVLYASPIDPSQPLRESVRAHRIRHRAPPGRQRFRFAVGQPVEVPYRNGWWPGVVVGVPDWPKVREYTALVLKTGEKISCSGRGLRRSMRAALEEYEGLTEPVRGKRRKKNTPQESGVKKRIIDGIMASAQVGEHQESMPVNMPSAEYDSTIGTDLVNQGDTGTKSLDGDELLNMTADVACSNLPGLPNSHPHQDDVVTDEETILTTPGVGITGDSVHDHQETLLVNKRSVKGDSTLGTEQVTPRDVYMEKLDGHELSSTIWPVSSLLGASNSQYHYDEAGKEQEGFVSTPSAEIVGDVSAPLSNGSGSFPFVKRSPMWKYIDSEVIPKMRQHPHFRPLEQCPEVQREGIALGLVVTCENLMNSVGSLKMDTSNENLDKNENIITNLEEHGFDVQHIRTCLEEPKRLKKKRKKLLQKKSAIEEQALEIEMKSGHLNAQLEATNKATSALMVAVHLFDERRASLSEQKEESEIISAKLQSELRLVEEELLSSDRALQDLLNGVQ